ncbi:Potassium voltage-gated channel sub H member 3 [Bulinus truncatus]|nr:Potassium voltage-gated channel sub H member 3 [Bulinus truncatus]
MTRIVLSQMLVKKDDQDCVSHVGQERLLELCYLMLVKKDDQNCVISRWSRKMTRIVLSHVDSNFVLGNAQANGWPIVYCSDGFCELTGFSRANVMAKGSGCRFLYGTETSEAEVQKIQEALEEKRELKTEVQLYNKSGTPFWCLLDIVPIKNEKRDVVLFLVSHKDITKDKDKPDPDSLSKKSNSDGSSDEDNDNDDDGMPENYDYGRRRSRAVLYHISGQLNKHNKAKSKLQQLNRVVCF